MQLIYSCVEELKQLHGRELEILIFYEDQPVNDFTSLFSFLQGITVIEKMKIYKNELWINLRWLDRVVD